MYFLSKLGQSTILYYFFIFRNFENARIPRNTAKKAAVAPAIAITITTGSGDITDGSGLAMVAANGAMVPLLLRDSVACGKLFCAISEIGALWFADWACSTR